MLHDSSTVPPSNRRLAPVLAVAALLPIDFVGRPLAPVIELGPPPTVAEQHAAEGLESHVLLVKAPAVEAKPLSVRAAAKKPELGPRPLAAVAREVGKPDEPVVFIHDGETMVNGPGGVDIDDVRAVGSFSRNAGGGDLLWFRYQGKDYYTRDAATIQEVSDIYGPIKELGRRQGEIGQHEGALGTQEGKLGQEEGNLSAEQGKLEAKVGELESKVAAREAEIAARRANGDQDSAKEIDELKADLMRARKAVRDQAQVIRDRVRDLSKQQRELGDQQRELGHQQQELGRQEKLASEAAQIKIHALIERIVAAKLAQPMP